MLINRKLKMILNRLPKTVTYKGIICSVVSGTWINDNGKATVTEFNIKFNGDVIAVRPKDVVL